MRRRQPFSTLWGGVIAGIVILVVCYLVFGGSVPFTQPTLFHLKAMFTTETALQIPSPVRVAGVNVGQVTGVSRLPGGTQAAEVSMDITNQGLPIHADATVKIRPRIFLEGNYYVDLRPGSPSAPTLQSGATLAAANTAGPVQLDRVLSALGSNSRTDLQTLLQGFGGALDSSPSTLDPSQDPLTRS